MTTQRISGFLPLDADGMPLAGGRVTVDQRSTDWIAFATGDRARWEAGPTAALVIERLRVTHPDLFEQRPRASGRDVRQEIAYVMDHGQSPESDAARLLQRFMCCQAGQDLVEHGLLRPFGYTFEPGRVVSANRQLRDELQHWEAILAGEAHELHDHPERAGALADMLGTVCESMRRLFKTTEAM